MSFRFISCSPNRCCVFVLYYPLQLLIQIVLSRIQVVMIMKTHKKGGCCVLFFLSFPSSAKHKSQKILLTHTHIHIDQHSHKAFPHRTHTPYKQTIHRQQYQATTSITMSSSNSAATPQEKVEHKCFIDAIDKDGQKPFVEVVTDDHKGVDLRTEGTGF